jgi:hypothetical protein
LRSAAERERNPERINLDNRGLRAVPQVPTDESALKLLNLQHNSIATLRGAFSLQPHLSRLIFLDLFANDVDDLTGLDALPLLRVLMLGKNRIRYISKINLSKNRHLDVLDLHSNEISEIDPEAFTALTDLRVLNLAGNALTKVDYIKKMPSLTEVNLRKNAITAVFHLETNPRLQRVFLSSNKLTSLAQLNGFLPSSIDTAPPPSFAASGLSEVALDGNPFAYEYRARVIALLPSLRFLDHTKITDSERETSLRLLRESPGLGLGPSMDVAISVNSGAFGVVGSSTGSSPSSAVSGLKTSSIVSSGTATASVGTSRKKEEYSDTVFRVAYTQESGALTVSGYHSPSDNPQFVIPSNAQSIASLVFQRVSLEMVAAESVLGRLRSRIIPANTQLLVFKDGCLNVTAGFLMRILTALCPPVTILRFPATDFPVDPLMLIGLAPSLLQVNDVVVTDELRLRASNLFSKSAFWHSVAPIKLVPLQIDEDDECDAAALADNSRRNRDAYGRLWDVSRSAKRQQQSQQQPSAAASFVTRLVSDAKQIEVKLAWLSQNFDDALRKLIAERLAALKEADAT